MIRIYDDLMKNQLPEEILFDFTDGMCKIYIAVIGSLQKLE